MIRLGQEIFLVPYENQKFYYVYFPLKGCFFRCENNLIDQIIDYCEHGKIKNEYSILKKRIDEIISKPNLPVKENKSSFPELLCFLLSEKCNLSCTYCYAHDSHINIELTEDNVKIYLDYFFSFREKHRRIAFLGGGEPLLSWKLIVYAVNYAKNKAHEFNEDIRFSITTNLTILSSEMINFIKENNIVVAVSFDVLPEVQNKQRVFPNGEGSFQIVDRNIKRLLKNGIIPHIRSTITSENVNRMTDMLQFIITNYPQIYKVHFEHVSDIETLSNEKYVSEFIKNYFSTLVIAKQQKKDLTNSAINSIKRVRKDFCSKEFCITATNEIVSCHRVSTSNGANPFKYGKLIDAEIYLDESHKEELFVPQNCKSCFARYNCAGGCRYNRFILGEEQFSNYCDFMQKMMLGYFDFLLVNSK